MLYSNSALVLAASDFYLPIKKINCESERIAKGTKAITSYPNCNIITKQTITMCEKPSSKLFHIKDIFSGVHRSQDPKIRVMDCLYQKKGTSEHDRLVDLHFEKVTLHQRFSTDKSFLSSMYSMLESIRSNIEKVASISIAGWKPSFLMLKSVNKDKTFSNRDFLTDIQIDLSQRNKMLRQLIDTIWEVPTRTGVISYEPIM